jgi:hypothetical protein
MRVLVAGDRGGDMPRSTNVWRSSAEHSRQRGYDMDVFPP